MAELTKDAKCREIVARLEDDALQQWIENLKNNDASPASRIEMIAFRFGFEAGYDAGAKAQREKDELICGRLAYMSCDSKLQSAYKECAAAISQGRQ